MIRGSGVGVRGSGFGVRGVVLAALLCVVATLAWAADSQVYQSVNATTSNTTVDLGEVSTVVIANDGTASVYVNLAGATATTANMEIKSGEILTHTYRTRQIGIITASGTATVRVTGWK